VVGRTIPMERGTFQDSAVKLFKALLANIRKCSKFKVYSREVSAYLKVAKWMFLKHMVIIVALI